MDFVIPKWLPWSYALRAVAAIILGILMFIFPAAGLATFILLFGVFSLADGIFATIAAFTGRDGKGFDGAMLLYGLLGIAIGAMFLILPGLSLTAFILVVAVWMVVLGASTFISAISWRKSLPHPWVPILLAIFSILFGIYLFVFPLAGVAAIPFALGFYALLWGALMLGTANELWRFRPSFDEKRGQADGV